MEIKEAIRAALKELIMPEIDIIKEENREIKTLLTLTNKRLDDINLHLADQSRRIDSLREELSQRIDQNNLRIDSIRDELTGRIAQTNQRINEVHMDLIHRNDVTNQALYRLYEVIVRKEEHVMVAERVAILERELSEIKRRLAA